MKTSRSLVRLVVAASAALVLSAPVAAQRFDSTTRTVNVTPTGSDDTAAMALAFDICLSVGAACTVQLSEGTFYTRQQDVEGFVGTFAGAGRELTIVEALTPYVVSPPRVDILLQDPDRGGSPVMFSFFDADIVIRDMTIAVRGVSPSEPWLFDGNPIDTLAVAVSFSGPGNRGVVERVAIEGENVGFFGTNLFNGFYALPETGDTGLTSSSDLEFRDIRISGVGGGVVFSQLRDSSIRISGSVIQAYEPIGLDDVAASVVVIAGNELRNQDDPGIMIRTKRVTDDDRPLQVWIVDNTFVVTGPESSGVLLDDTTTVGVVMAILTGNTFDLRGALAGVRGQSQHTVVADNTFAGSAQSAVQAGMLGLRGGWLIARNDVSALTASAGAILVPSGITGAIVICSSTGELVDLGTGTRGICD